MEMRCERVTAVLPDEAAYRAAFLALPEWRRRKCDALRFSADRLRSVAAWELLRRMLDAKGLEANALEVSENEFGKPSFDPPFGLHFSLSHAGDRVMAALSETEIGCDVEQVVSVDEELVKAVLTDAERTSLAGLSGPDRDRAFVRLWVRKESYAKAVGRGIGLDLASFSALGLPPQPSLSWQDFDFGDGHLGCVAFSSNFPC